MRSLRALLALWLLALATAASAAEPIRLAVFHTNDIHGWLMDRPAFWHKPDPARRVGGAPAMANALKRHAAGRPYLLLDGGDWYQGTPEGTIPRGRAVAEFFNAMRYDAVVVGNHEYDFGQEVVEKLVAQLKVPALGANVIDAVSGKPVGYLKPYVIKKVAGVKVAVIGILTSNMRNLQFERNVAGLEFKGEIETAARLVAAARKEGADVVIALTHIGIEKPDRAPFLGDQTLAAHVPGIDLIVGGHSHTAIPEPSTHPAGGTLIVQAGSFLSYLGQVDLEIDPKTKKVVKASGRLHELWVDEYGEDAAMKTLVERYRREVAPMVDVAVGTAAETLTRDHHRESHLGGWMTDCLRKWSKTDIAFQNSGGIRADLKAGPVTRRDLFNVMPFDNYVVTLNLKGRGVRQILERSVDGAARGLMQVSGISMRWDPSAPPGRRVRRALVDGQPLDDERFYSVTAPDFIVKLGDGYTPFADAVDVAYSQTLVREALEWCAQGYSPIRARPLDRIVRE